MNLHEIVKKLVGPINPIGETNLDGKRLENLKVMTELVDALLTDIDAVTTNKDMPEHSRRVAGKFAYDFMGRMGITD